ncbi:MAG: SPOR domain-containing protein [Bryobacteraceae bacterium]
MFPSLTGTHQELPNDAGSELLTAEPKKGLSSRQLAVYGFGGLTLITIVAAAAYMAGRLAEIEGRNVAADGKQAEQIIVVDPPAARVAIPSESVATVAVKPAAPVPVEPGPAAKAPEPVAVAPVPAVAPASPVAGTGGGEMFFQVAALDKAMADVSADYLTRKGLPARVGAGPSATVFRVLVGPLASEEETNRIKASLEELGFHPFLKKM